MEANDFKRKLSAILSADAVGYSRLMNDDDEATIRTLQAYRQVFAETIQRHRGRLVDSPGDNLLAEFASVVDALRCAVNVQQDLHHRNRSLPRRRQMHFRIGINLGDVIEDHGRLYGDGVNIAARLENLADPGGILISGAAYDQVKNKIPNRIDPAGQQRVKNIPGTVRTYRVITAHATQHRASLATVQPFRPAGARTVWLAIGIAAAMVGLIYWAFMYGRSPSSGRSGDDLPVDRLSQKTAIAVLPFKNLSDDSQQEYFSDGITNDIITDLSRFSGLLVIASNTAFRYKDRTVDMKAVGKELQVDYILAGSVQKAGDAVRINAQLIDAADGTHVWAERYDRDYTDIFGLQSEIVQTIVAKLAAKTFQHEQVRAMHKNPQDLLAYDYLLRGYALYHQRTRTTHAEAMQMFAKAVELDPTFAAAYVGMGELVYSQVAYGWTEFPDVALDRALSFGLRALALDEANASAHALLSSIYTFQNKYELAIKEAERAIELNPNHAGSYSELGWALLWSGQVDKAITALEMALRLDMATPREIWFHLGIAYYLKADYRKASDILEEGLVKRPGFAGYHIALAAAYARLGRDDAAAREAAAVRRLDPFFKVASFGTGFRLPAHRQAIAAGLRQAGLE